jgi:hypothetical protein
MVVLPQDLCYWHLCFGGVISNRMKEVWDAKLPLKVKIFLWQMVHGKLQTAEQLKKREWKGKINCPPMWSGGGCESHHV